MDGKRETREIPAGAGGGGAGAAGGGPLGGEPIAGGCGRAGAQGAMRREGTGNGEVLEPRCGLGQPALSPVAARTGLRVPAARMAGWVGFLRLAGERREK